jgi:hypothetical protein
MKVGKIAILLLVLVLFGTCDYVAAGCREGDRYEVNGTSGTVTDCRTGLIWLQNAKCTDTSSGNPNGYLTWSNAMKWVAGLYGDGSGSTICGLSDGSSAGDWRLPTKTEWMAMVVYARYTHVPAFTDPALTNDAGTDKWGASGTSSFTNVVSSHYWSSTTDAGNTTNAWNVNVDYGTMGIDVKANIGYVWPVRGGQSGSFGSLRIE